MMDQRISFEFENKVWLYNAENGSWHFITLPESLGKEIKEIFGHTSKGWGSIPVNVSVGESQWKTSIFPDKKENSYVLPLKASVRKAENISDGNTIHVSITIKF